MNTPLGTLFCSLCLFTVIAYCAWAWLAVAALLASPGLEDPASSRLPHVQALHAKSRVASVIAILCTMLTAGIGVAVLVAGGAH